MFSLPVSKAGTAFPCLPVSSALAGFFAFVGVVDLKKLVVAMS